MGHSTQSVAKTEIPFSVPRDGEIFVNNILERCQSLITARIWEGLPLHRLDTWMTNFNTPIQRYFAACILDALIYRSRMQTVALMRQHFERVLPDLIHLDPPQYGPVQGWQSLLTQPSHLEPGLRLVPVIRSTDPPTKSGPLIARRYRRHLRFNHNWMIWPWQIGHARSNGVQVFVFIDDFLGTGVQFTEFAKQFSLADNLQDSYAVYAPLVAHIDGLQSLRRSFSNLRVAAVEVLDEGYNLFSPNSNWFHDGTNSPAAARQFYDDLIRSKKLAILSGQQQGFGQLALAYTFEHATPDNCLPILWIETETWKPLFER